MSFAASNQHELVRALLSRGETWRRISQVLICETS
jgi:hypothetical protein